MKRIIYIVLLFIFIFQYKTVNAEDICTPNNYPTIFNLKDFHLKIGSEKPNYLLGVYAIDSCNRLTSITVVDNDVKYEEVGEYTVFYYSKSTLAEVTVFIESGLRTPIFSGLKNHKIEINSSFDDLYNVEAYDYNNIEITEKIEVDRYDLELTQLGIYLITYRIEDNEGNRFDQDVTVQVVDTVKPTIENYQDLTIEVHTIKEEYNWWEGIIVEDNSNLEVTRSIDFTNLNIDELGEYNITYIVKDSSGNEISETVKVEIIDTTPPEIIADNISFNLSDQITDYDFKSIIEVTDNYDGEIDLEKIYVDKHNVNFNEPGIYKVFIYASDSKGNFSTKIISIAIIDDVKPEINGTKDIEILVGATYEDLQDVCENEISAFDLVDGDLTGHIYIDYLQINLDKVGEYSLIYIVFDSSGNKDVKIVTVNVTDAEVPKIHGVDDLTIEVFTDSYNFLDGITASDNIDGDLTLLIEADLSNLDLSNLGTYTITYTVKDSQNNEATVTCLVTIVDTTAPEIIGYNDITIKTNEVIDLLKNISAIDNYDGDLTEEIIVSGDYDIGVAGVYTITLEVSDASDNKKTISYLLYVEIVDNPIDRSPEKEKDYSLYYIISIIGASLIASGIMGYKTRKKYNK